jgi:hypothetical protein
MASGQTLMQWHPYSNEQPVTGGARMAFRNNHPVLKFLADADEDAIFSGILPQSYQGGGLRVIVHFSMTAGTGGGTVDLEASFERVGIEQQDIDSDGFAAAQGVSDIAVPATSGHVKSQQIGFQDGAQIDNIAVGEKFRLRIRRKGTTDDAPDPMELNLVELREG